MEANLEGQVRRESCSKLFIKAIFRFMTEIEIDSVSKRFAEHLKVEQNYRIILSGKFGIGKTFFLKKFFEARENEYNTVFIYPVNYVVSSNEDIFELIKVDIVKQLFAAKKPRAKKTVSAPERIALFASEKPHHFLKFITSSFKKINPFIGIADDVYDGINTLYSKYKEYEKGLESRFKIPEERLEEFADSFHDKVGNLFEEDFMTKTLKEELLKRKHGGKKNALIIDDLDRIDPEHIFRILNILSAHNNDFASKNKFEFDHVIIVCDNDNIRNIFHHKYGTNVDFDGYIDKFFSTEIFHYKNDEAIRFYVKSIFKIDKEPIGFIELIVFILNTLVDTKRVTVRQIIKHLYKVDIGIFKLYEQKGLIEKNTFLRHEPNFIASWDNFFVDSSDLQILRIFKLMSVIFGDFNIFYEHVDQLAKIKTSCDADNLKSLLSFLVLQNHIAANTGDKLFFHVVYGKNNKEESAITELHQPQASFVSINNYNIKLHWDHSFPYNGQTSYFFEAQAINSDRHQYMGNKPKRLFESSEIFKAINSIISDCQDKGYLDNAGIVLNIRNED
jgi:Cdc6-like AAA superfamily ATPase